MHYPDCPSFCLDCIFDNQVNYISSCVTCRGDRILDQEGQFCFCPEGYYDDYLSENCQQIGQQNPLVLYFSFDDSVSDIALKYNQQIQNKATLFNVEKTTDKFGIQNRAYTFLPETQNSKIIIDNQDLFHFGQKYFTLTFWLKGPIQSKYEWGCIFGNDLQNGIQVMRYNSSQDMRISINGVYIDVQNVFTGDWEFIVIQRKLDKIIVYINNQIIIDNHYIGQQNLNSRNQVCIGRQCDDRRPFDGSIDEFQVHEEYLLLEQLQQIYNYQCIFPCLECNYLENGKTCLSCKGDRIFSNGSCLCPDGKYDDFQSENCLKCPENCSLCTGPQNCLECIDQIDIEKSFRIVDNICECPAQGYYDNKPFCQSCNNIRCLTCFEFQTCDTCVGSNQEEQNRRQESKICECPSGYLDEIDNPQQIDCIKCNVKTKHCISCNQFGGECQVCEGDLVYFGGLCQCPKGTFAKDLSNLIETQCEACPSEKAVCNGGYEIVLKNGYWRQNTQSSDILLCYNNKNNCVGGSGANLCKKGHKGALCEACDLDDSMGQGSYANSGDFECSSCDKVENNGLKIFGLIMLQMVSLYLAVVGTIIAMQDQIQFNCIKLLFFSGTPMTDEQGVLIKILQNYLYIISAIVTFQIELPKELIKYFQTTSTPAKQMAYSFDCALQEMQNEMPVFYFRIIWQIIISVLQLVVVYLIGIILIKLKKTNMTFVSLFWTALIHQYVSLQPAIITMVLEAIACRKIGDVYYTLSNTSIECYDSSYFKYTYSFLLPIFLIWAIVIPFLLLNTIKRQINIQKQNKNQIDPKNQQILQLQYQLSPLDNPNILLKFGYLYLEYEQNVYWWEFVKIFQRILIATILSFYYNDIYIKGILVFMIVVFYGILQVKYRPYKIYSQNKMDLISMLVTGVTLICGLFLYNNKYSYWVITGLVFLFIINLGLVCIILRRIILANSRSLIQKITQQREKYQQQEIYLKNVQKQNQIQKQIEEQNKDNTQQIQKYVQQIQEIKEEIGQLDLQYIEDIENDKNNKNDIPNQKGIAVKILKNIDQLQVKYLGYPNAETLSQVKKFKFVLQKYVNLYIDGIKAGLVEPLFKNNSLKNQQIKPQQKEYIFSTADLLDGSITQEQYQELEQKLKFYRNQIKYEENQIQKILKQKITVLFKINNFNQKYLSEQYLQNNNEQLNQKNNLQQNNEQLNQNEGLQQNIDINNNNNNNLQDYLNNNIGRRLTIDNQRTNIERRLTIETQRTNVSDKSQIIDQNEDIFDNIQKNNSKTIQIQSKDQQQKQQQQCQKQNHDINNIKVKLNMQFSDQKKLIMSSSNESDIKDQKENQDHLQIRKRKRRSTLQRKRNFTINIEGNNEETIQRHDSIIINDNNKQVNKQYCDNNYQQNQENDKQNQEKIRLKSELIFQESNIQEMQQFLIPFQLLDIDNKGKVSKLQIVSVMKNLGIFISKGQIDKIYEQFDIQENEVDFASFLARILQQKYYKQPLDLVKEIFSRFDDNSNGVIEHEEIQEIANTILTQKFDLEVYKELVRQEQRAGDTGLTLHEFLHLIL